MYVELLRTVLYLIALVLLLTLSLAAGVLLINLPTIVRTRGPAMTVIALIGAFIVLPSLAYLTLSGIDSIELLFRR